MQSRTSIGRLGAQRRLAMNPATAAALANYLAHGNNQMSG